MLLLARYARSAAINYELNERRAKLCLIAVITIEPADKVFFVKYKSACIRGIWVTAVRKTAHKSLLGVETADNSKNSH